MMSNEAFSRVVIDAQLADLKGQVVDPEQIGKVPKHLVVKTANNRLKPL